jgi:hypothetical protein
MKWRIREIKIVREPQIRQALLKTEFSGLFDQTPDAPDKSL